MSADVLEVNPYGDPAAVNPYADPATANPYAPPASVEPVSCEPVIDSFEQIRRDHFKIERAIKSVGSFYGLGAFMTFVTAILTLTAALVAADAPLGMLIFGGIQGAFGLFLAALCVSLKRLKRGARWPAVILAIPMLLAFPVGTLVGVYILYSLLCKRGWLVLTEEYREIIRRTPQVTRRTSALTWIVLAVIVLLAGWAVVACVQF